MLGTQYDAVELSAGWVRDSRNRLLFPTSGSLQRLQLSGTVPGTGSVEYLRSTFQYQQFFRLPLLPLTFSFNTNLSYGTAFGDTTGPAAEPALLRRRPRLGPRLPRSDARPARLARQSVRRRQRAERPARSDRADAVEVREQRARQRVRRLRPGLLPRRHAVLRQGRLSRGLRLRARRSCASRSASACNGSRRSACSASAMPSRSAIAAIPGASSATSWSASSSRSAAPSEPFTCIEPGDIPMRSRSCLYPILAALTALSLSGCDSGGGSGRTQVRLMNASPGYTSLDLYANTADDDTDRQRIAAVGVRHRQQLHGARVRHVQRQVQAQRFHQHAADGERQTARGRYASHVRRLRFDGTFFFAAGRRRRDSAGQRSRQSAGAERGGGRHARRVPDGELGVARRCYARGLRRGTRHRQCSLRRSTAATIGCA